MEESFASVMASVLGWFIIVFLYTETQTVTVCPGPPLLPSPRLFPPPSLCNSVLLVKGSGNHMPQVFLRDVTRGRKRYSNTKN